VEAGGYFLDETQARLQNTFACSSSLASAVQLGMSRWRIAFPLFPSAISYAIFLKSQQTAFQTKEPASMEWTTPQHEGIDLNCEVSSYSNAEL